MEKDQDDERVALTGLGPREALKALLAVDPESEPVQEDDKPSEREADSEAPGDTARDTA